MCGCANCRASGHCIYCRRLMGRCNDHHCCDCHCSACHYLRVWRAMTPEERREGLRQFHQGVGIVGYGCFLILAAGGIMTALVLVVGLALRVHG